MSTYELKKLIFTNETGSLPYRLWIPSHNTGEKLPVLFFLHGAGERGADNELQTKVGICSHYFSQEIAHKYPAIFVAPQCPDGVSWDNKLGWLCDYDDVNVESKPMKLAYELLCEILKREDADRTRVYVTGLSMGGYGTWDMIVRHQGVFAAAVPVCGGAFPEDAEKIKDVPIWAFHGDSDSCVPVENTRNIVDALRAIGSDVKYTEYPGCDHNCWDNAYSDMAMYEWLFSK
ncbi:MAG TPA: dienelactone hydrolase family protein [Bacillota bacterium]|nr:dienelactone hydrolase family protein [Bacillota bacterium]